MSYLTDRYRSRDSALGVSKGKRRQQVTCTCRDQRIFIVHTTKFV